MSKDKIRRPYFLKGHTSHLRGHCTQDYQIISDNVNDPKLNRLLYQGSKPVNAEYIKKQIETEDDQGAIQFAQCRISDEKMVGWCGLFPTRRIERVWDMRSFVIPTVWGKGFGTEQHAMLIKIGFERLNAHKITAGTNENNNGVLRIYEKLGITKEGVFRKDYYRDGKYQDTHHYGVLLSEYESKVKDLCNSYLL